MPKEYGRNRRVGELLQRELATLIPLEVSDPRVGDITVTGVEVSRDLSTARVFVSRLGGEVLAEQSVAALNHAAGFLRRSLRERTTLRAVPALHFHYDASLERGSRLSNLIDRAVAADHKKEPE